MLSINAPKYTPPAGYQLSEVDKPAFEGPKDVIIKVHASSINPIDVVKANGVMKMFMKDSFPYQIGYDCAGVVDEVGSEVTKFKAGDEVFTRLLDCQRGAWSEYCKTTEDNVVKLPAGCSMADAASIPLVGVTALQAMRAYKGDLEGKTVFVTSGLSGTGLFACQLAKNVFKAGKVITTVSTAKVPKVPELLGEGVVDQVIDYRTSDPRTVIPKGSIDLFFDTTGEAMSYLAHMTPKTSTIVSISTMPSGDVMANSTFLNRSSYGNDRHPFPGSARFVLNVLDSVRCWRAYRWGVHYTYIFVDPSGEDLDELRQYYEEGKLRAVIGSKIHYKDMQAVRDACQVVFDGKGGIGKTVIMFD